MRILITGASKGIGRAIATRLAAPGVKLALCGRSESSDLISLTEEVAALGAEPLTFCGELADPATPELLVTGAATMMGGLDAVVCNAGISRPNSLHELSLETWDEIFAVNVRAPWLLARSSLPYLKASRGALVAVASMSGVEPYPGMGAYSPTKAALIMLARVLALEWARDGVRVNVVSPGLVSTPLTKEIYSDEAKKAQRSGLVPIGRIGEPARDIAGVVAFLLSPDAGYMTGQNLIVDGGLLGSIQTHLAGRPGKQG